MKKLLKYWKSFGKILRFDFKFPFLIKKFINYRIKKIFGKKNIIYSSYISYSKFN